MSLSLMNFTSLSHIPLIAPPQPIHSGYCGIPYISLNHSRTLSLPFFPVYECGSCVSICHTYGSDTPDNKITKCIDVLVAEAHPFQTEFISIADDMIDSGIEVGEELYKELGRGGLAAEEPQYKSVRMSTVALERCGGVWDGGVLEGKLPQGQFAILEEMIPRPRGGEDVREKDEEKVASPRVRRRGMVRTGVEGRLINLRQSVTDSAEEMEKVYSALSCVGELIRGGVSETEAEEKCELESILDSAA